MDAFHMDADIKISWRIIFSLFFEGRHMKANELFMSHGKASGRCVPCSICSSVNIVLASAFECRVHSCMFQISRCPHSEVQRTPANSVKNNVSEPRLHFVIMRCCLNWDGDVFTEPYFVNMCWGKVKMLKKQALLLLLSLQPQWTVRVEAKDAAGSLQARDVWSRAVLANLIWDADTLTTCLSM